MFPGIKIMRSILSSSLTSMHGLFVGLVIEIKQSCQDSWSDLFIRLVVRLCQLINVVDVIAEQGIFSDAATS